MRYILGTSSYNQQRISRQARRDIRVEILLALFYTLSFVPSTQMSRNLGFVGHGDSVPFLDVVQILYVFVQPPVYRCSCACTYVMSNGDIIRPSGRAQDRLFHESGRFAQQSFGRISQDAEHDLVILLLVDWQILIGADGVVMVLLRSTRADLHADAAFASFGNRDDFGIQTDLHPTVS